MNSYITKIDSKLNIVNICVKIHIEIKQNPLYLIVDVFKFRKKRESNGTLFFVPSSKVFQFLMKKYKVSRTKIMEVINMAKKAQRDGAEPNDLRYHVFFPHINKTLYHRNGQGYVQSQFTAIRQFIEYPENTCLNFEKAIIMCVGIKNYIKSSIENNLAKISNILQSDVRVVSSEVVNIVVSFRLPFGISFSKLKEFLNVNNIYYNNNNNTFSGFFVKILVPTKPINQNSTRSFVDFYDQQLPVNHKNYRVVTLLLFNIGVVVILGNQGFQDWQVNYNLLKGFFIHFSNGTNKLNDSEVRELSRLYNFKGLDWFGSINFFLKSDKKCSLSRVEEYGKYQEDYVLFNYQDNCKKTLHSTEYDMIKYMNSYILTEEEPGDFEKYIEDKKRERRLLDDRHQRDNSTEGTETYVTSNLMKDGSIKIVDVKKLRRNQQYHHIAVEGTKKVLMITKDFESLMEASASHPGNPQHHNSSYRNKYPQMKIQKQILNTNMLKGLHRKVLMGNDGLKQEHKNSSDHNGNFNTGFCCPCKD